MSHLDLIEFVRAVALALPPDAPRNKFGQYTGPRHTDPLRLMAVRLGCAGNCRDINDQIGRVAQKLLQLEMSEQT